LTFINPQAPQVQSESQSAKISTNQNVTLSMPEKNLLTADKLKKPKPKCQQQQQLPQLWR